MSLLDIVKRVWKGRPQTSLTGSVGVSDAGPLVTDTSAMTIPAVIACIRVLSDSVASLPLVTYRKAELGKEEATRHPLYNLLLRQANPEQTAFTFKQSLMVSLLTRGNAYVEPEYASNGQVKNLWLIDPRSVTPRRDEDFNLVYDVQFPKGGHQVMRFPRILHICGLGDGTVGYSPIQLARGQLGVILSQQQYSASLMKNSARPNGVLKFPGELSQNAKEQLARDWQGYAGPGSAGRTPILEFGYEFQPLSFSPADTEFMAQQNWSVEQVCRIFNVSPGKIHSLANVKWSVAEQLNLDFYTNSVSPYLVMIEQAFDRLFSGNEFFLRHRVDDLLRADSKTLSEVCSQMVNAGIWSTNECRQRWGMNNIEGGDVMRSPLNLGAVSVTDDMNEENKPGEDTEEEEVKPTEE